MGRSWELFGRRKGGLWLTIGSEFYVRMHGCASPIPVTVTEDEAGEYLGWIDKEHSGSARTPDGVPTMILHEKIFEVQFPYGSAAEVVRGKGEVVRLSVAEMEGVVTESPVRVGRVEDVFAGRIRGGYVDVHALQSESRIHPLADVWDRPGGVIRLHVARAADGAVVVSISPADLSVFEKFISNAGSRFGLSVCVNERVLMLARKVWEAGELEVSGG